MGNLEDIVGIFYKYKGVLTLNSAVFPCIYSTDSTGGVITHSAEVCGIMLDTF